MTRIDSGVFALNLQNYNIAYLVEEIAQSSAQYMQELGIELSIPSGGQVQNQKCRG